MSSSDENKPKNEGQKIIEKFLKGPFLSDEEIAENEAASARLEGTSRESAYLNDEGMLVVHYWSQKDYVIGDGWDQVLPGETHYSELCKKHGLKKPGDSNVIVMRWVNGEWVEEKQEKSDKAKSA